MLYQYRKRHGIDERYLCPYLELKPGHPMSKATSLLNLAEVKQRVTI